MKSVHITDLTALDLISTDLISSELNVREATQFMYGRHQWFDNVR